MLEAAPEGADLVFNNGATIPNGTYVNIPYSGGGWFYGISIPPLEEKAVVKPKDGCQCKKCLEMYPYAEPNQEDGSLICWACRNY